MSKQASLWRFDAWNATAGLAFVSYRPADDYSDLLDLSIPTVFISAPDFQPEHVEGRSLALAASRRGFQQGFFVKGRELGFAELPQLIEYVRRAFIAAGTNGPENEDGGPALTPTSPTGGDGWDGERWGRQIEQGEVFGEFANLVHAFSGVTKQMEEGGIDSDGLARAQGFKWEVGSKESWDGSAHVLLEGALWIASELVRRCPFNQGRFSLYRWVEAWEKFVQAFEGLMLSRRRWEPDAISYERKGLFNRCMGDFVRQLNRDQELREELSDVFYITPLDLWFLVDRDAAEENTDGLYNFHPRDWFDFYGFRRWRVNSQLSWSHAPFRDLKRWPIPLNLAKLVNPVGPERANVSNLLAAFVASPSKFSDAGTSVLRTTLEICLFAAMCLTQGGSLGAAFEGSAREKLAQLFKSSVEHEEFHYYRACLWLLKQLPSVAFMPELEDILYNAAQPKSVEPDTVGA